jgi:PAS domain S-box-containing protein
MKLIAFIDLLSLIGFALAFFYLVKGWRSRPNWREEILLLVMAITLIASHNIKYVLKVGGMAYPLETYEEYIELLAIVLWGGFLYTMLQKVTEVTLREREEWYRLLFQKSNDAIFVHSLSSDGMPGRFEEVNAKACTRYGYSLARFRELTPSDIDDPVLNTNTPEIMEKLANEGSVTFERVHTASDGSHIPVEVSSHRFVFDGRPTIISIVRDLSRRKEAERKLREVQALDESILGSSPVAFILRDRDGRVVRLSRAVEKITGFKIDQMMGKTVEEFMPEAPGKKELIDRINRVLEEGVSLGPEDFRAPTRELKYIRERIVPITGEEGAITGALSILEDITERKIVADAIRQSEKNYRKLFNSVSDGVVIHSVGEKGIPDKFLQVNDTFCRMVGYELGELKEMSPLDLQEKGVSENDLETGRRMAEEGAVVFERILSNKAGRTISCEMHSQKYDLEGEQAVLTVVRDISERKMAEEQVRKSLREKETLLREIHHRVKNNLQVVSGLINLQAMYIPDEKSRQLYKDSQNRIKTMALIHEELYQQADLASIDFAEYIRGLSDNLLASYGVDSISVTLELALEKALVPLDTAIPCGLIVNELLSNSLKHAFPESGGGKLGVAFSRDGGGEFILKVWDDGVGFPPDLDFRKSGSLGLQLVTILAEQLGAEFRHEDKDGTAFTLTFREYREAGSQLA